jgi:biotin synthase-like enzyme
MILNGCYNQNCNARHASKTFGWKTNMSREGQAMCFAGANSIFAGDKLLYSNQMLKTMMKMLNY